MRRSGASPRRAICLGVLCVLLLGLFAFPGSAGQDPYHTHVVIGGTPAQRARALALHLQRERQGMDDMMPPVAPDAASRTGSDGVRVLSIRASHGGPAVLGVQGGDAVLLAGTPPVPVPSPVSWIATSRPAGIPRPAPPAPDPPPRLVSSARLHA